MPQKLLSLLVFLIIINQACFSQKRQIIKGNITCLCDSATIPYAHIGIWGKGIGTISNINGDFELKGQLNLEKDSLMVSHIEYEKKLIPLNELVSDTIHIQLKKSEYQLGEVIVLPDEKINEIFKHVIKNLKINYPDKLYQCEAFYREVQYELKSKTNTRLIEAAINIQDGKITSPRSKIKCSVLQLRKSKNYTQEHWGSKLMSKLFINYNQLYYLLRGNPTRCYKELLSKGDLYCNPIQWASENKKGTLSLKCLIKKKDQEIYVFQYDVGPELRFNFYINKSDCAILQFDHELRNIQKQSYHFTKIDDKYFPSFFKSENIQSVLKDSKGLGMTISSLSFVNHNPNRKDFKRLRSKHVAIKDLELYDLKMEYDENFWSSYNILLDEPIDPKIISDLEQDKSLKTQFKENSNL
ncbi:carboxypeptidase-like regulatory domain-containing protein [Marinifilum flexuosum]|uniref:carboxypeptidase-like regulatory domain-containing protein n=1 Tax=Marinifilum flexuosum TaxID=1117708 RepID=UPI002491E766|nr:carboxypeptidase-like regulatory domain-containing protein [Marinifilum flexuosum]